MRSQEEAEDILQEVWYQLSRIIDLDEIENLSGWLYRVARNKATEAIGRALLVLEEHGLAVKISESSGGRPAERWFAVRFVSDPTNPLKTE